MNLPCLINTGQISSNGCVNEKAMGKLSFCPCNLLLSNDVYLQKKKKKKKKKKDLRIKRIKHVPRIFLWHLIFFKYNSISCRPYGGNLPQFILK
jgi:hypothetical protein